MTPELSKPIHEINLDKAVKEAFDKEDPKNVFVTASATELEARINGAYLKISHSDRALRIAQWIIMIVTLGLALLAEATLPCVMGGFSFCVVLAVMGSLGVYLRKRLYTSFRTRVIDQIAWAEQMAHSEEEMMLAAVGCFWALRDTRPMLSSTFRFWHSDEGSNSVRETMLAPLVEAMRNLTKHTLKSSGGTFSRQFLFDQKFKYVAARIHDGNVVVHGAKEKEPGLETAWWRTVKIPFWINELFRNVGWTIGILLLILSFF
jgi:hypothetical protein